MSGTSMDGVDLAYTTFTASNSEKWDHKVLATRTITYPDNLLQLLKDSVSLSVEEMCLLDKSLGRFFGEQVNIFIEQNKIDATKIDAIASHGHTIFHQPDAGFTLQIGCGTTIASITQLNVINDFRTKDVVNGGQGAPLVPIGDSLLFGDHADAFLNIGGFANISLNKEPIIAYDIGPGNLPLNEICQKYFNRAYDKNGDLARSGKRISRLFSELNGLDYYYQSAPKSLGTEWLTQTFRPHVSSYSECRAADILRTITDHIAHQITRALNENECASVLITGGGAKNAFLVELIRSDFTGEVRIPSEELIEFKEAIVFAFLGALYLDSKLNTIHTVTGAKGDVRAGVLHTP